MGLNAAHAELAVLYNRFHLHSRYGTVRSEDPVIDILCTSTCDLHPPVCAAIACIRFGIPLDAVEERQDSDMKVCAEDASQEATSSVYVEVVGRHSSGVLQDGKNANGGGARICRHLWPRSFFRLGCNLDTLGYVQRRNLASITPANTDPMFEIRHGSR
jgi:hypothetical protein